MRIAAGIFSFFGFLVFLVCLWLVPAWLFYSHTAIPGMSLEGLVAIVLGMLGFSVVLYLVWRRQQFAEQKQLAERYMRAASQLGSDKVEIRLAGLYELEAITRDSRGYNTQIMELMSAYVKEHSPWPWTKPVPVPDKIGTDMQVILKIIGRRGGRFRMDTLAKLDLSNTFLKNADFRGLYFEDVELRSCNMQGADLTMANLRGVNLENSNLMDANLKDADLEGAKL